jgi:hypothetical protein
LRLGGAKGYGGAALYRLAPSVNGKE